MSAPLGRVHTGWLRRSRARMSSTCPWSSTTSPPAENSRIGRGRPSAMIVMIRDPHRRPVAGPRGLGSEAGTCDQWSVRPDDLLAHFPDGAVPRPAQIHLLSRLGRALAEAEDDPE